MGRGERFYLLKWLQIIKVESVTSRTELCEGDRIKGLISVEKWSSRVTCGAGPKEGGSSELGEGGGRSGDDRA